MKVRESVRYFFVVGCARGSIVCDLCIVCASENVFVCVKDGSLRSYIIKVCYYIKSYFVQLKMVVLLECRAEIN